MKEAHSLLAALEALSLDSARTLVLAAHMVAKGVEIELLMPGTECELRTRLLGGTGIRYDILGTPFVDYEKRSVAGSVQRPVSHVFRATPGQAFLQFDGPVHHETKKLLIVVQDEEQAEKIAD